MNTSALYRLLEFEPYFILCSLIALAWIFYQVFLREVSPERHKNLRAHFRNLMRHFVFFSTLFVVFIILHQASADSNFAKITPYMALGCLATGMIVFVKACRLIILQYLFLGSMKHGVPVLMVNIFSLIMSLVLVMWVAASIFTIELTPLLATSAAFSVVLGLAMQDTLGNLFAGISLQVDRAFDIGDWLEVTIGGVKTVGQVKEITWRATVMVGWADELIILPNRTLSNSQIANFSLGDQPIIRSQMFRVRYGTDLQVAKQALLAGLKDVKVIRSWPEPLVIITEMNESWVGLKLVYFIENFGSQFTIGDHVIEAALQSLMASGIEPAPQRMDLHTPERPA